jgi:hypothetical protein
MEDGGFSKQVFAHFRSFLLLSFSFFFCEGAPTRHARGQRFRFVYQMVGRIIGEETFKSAKDLFIWLTTAVHHTSWIVSDIKLQETLPSTTTTREW